MEKIRLVELTDIILKEMETAGFKQKTRKFYAVLFNRLQKLAARKKEDYYIGELGREFITDDSHITPENTERYCHERTLAYTRVIKFIESYIRDGFVDWSPALPCAEFPLKSAEMKQLFDRYLQELNDQGLKHNTIDGYRRFTYYFLEYLDSKGYRTIDDLKNGDVLAFITLICSERYQPTSLGSHMPGLRILLKMQDETSRFLCEIPEHLPKKREILKIYSDYEYENILNYLDKSERISFRNKALTIIALDTGLRAVDICNLRLTNIDWEHDCIHIIQQKTDRIHNIPLSENMGNAIVDYLLNERPVSDSDFLFLCSNAPFKPLMSHSGVRNVLFNVVNDAEIEVAGRIYGSRITRHSAASRMLRNGIPLSVISEALGHGNPNSVMVYLTTDDAKLAECTLPLPNGGEHNE